MQIGHVSALTPPSTKGVTPYIHKICVLNFTTITPYFDNI